MLKKGLNWQCPFCRHFQVLSEANLHATSGLIGTQLNKHGVAVGAITVVECMNPECSEFFSKVELGTAFKSGNTVYNSTIGKTVFEYQLRPLSIAKPQHSAVPSRLIKDYEEACAIINFSPKASATLSRRCLQGMIRNFCKISKATLHAEISELRKQVEENTAPRQVSIESISAIDSVRKLGNIGAHFEKDIDLIVEVEPEEANAMIGLIELLFEEWYVASYERKRRLEKVNSIASGKDQQRTKV